MVFDSYLLPVMQNHTKSILDYDVEISELRSEATFFVPAETGESKTENKLSVSQYISPTKSCMKCSKEVHKNQNILNDCFSLYEERRETMFQEIIRSVVESVGK